MVYCYNLAAYFSFIPCSSKDISGHNIQSHFAYFALVILMLLMIEIKENNLLEGGLCSFQGKSVKNMMAFARLTCIAS